MWFGGGKPKQEIQPEALWGAPLFEGLSEEQFRSILSCCQEITFETGATIFKADAVGDAAYFILSGVVAVRMADSAKNVQEAECGVLLGELSMLVDVTYNATVSAKSRVKTLAIRRDGLHEVLNANPSIADHFSQKLVERLLGLADELRAIDAKFAALEEAMAEAV
jgi:CRP/FNR family cyclic AMP-dependent transcriptional regulator